jgi:hypothetical protein
VYSTPTQTPTTGEPSSQKRCPTHHRTMRLAKAESRWSAAHRYNGRGLPGPSKSRRAIDLSAVVGPFLVGDAERGRRARTLRCASSSSAKDKPSEQHSPHNSRKPQHRPPDDAGFRIPLPEKPDDHFDDKDGIQDGKDREAPLPPRNPEGVTLGKPNDEKQTGRCERAHDEFSHVVKSYSVAMVLSSTIFPTESW